MYYLKFKYLLLFLIFSCVSSPHLFEEYKLLTNNSKKYWLITHINNHRVKINKTIWMFDKKRNYIQYTYNDSLTIINSGDEVYVNRFEILNKKRILLNRYQNHLIYLDKDSLVISNDNYSYILKPIQLNSSTTILRD